jgi:excisionase family DNA binding protein
MTDRSVRVPDPVTAAAANLAAAIAQLVEASIAAALAGHRCAGSDPGEARPVLLTYKQACEQLGISESMLYKLLRAGAIQSVSLSKQTRRIPAAELGRYAATLLDAPAEDAS